VAFFGLGDVGRAEVEGVDGFLGVVVFLFFGEGEPGFGEMRGVGGLVVDELFFVVAEEVEVVTGLGGD